MWNAPHCSAASPSRASASLQSTRIAVLGADRERLLRYRVDVRLVVLAEVGRERVRDRAVLAHPGERAARVEPARERDPDPLADRQRVEDDAGRNVDAHRWLRRWASSSTPRQAVARGDEDGVVAGDRAGHLGQRGVVDRVGERGGEAARRLDHEHRPGGGRLAHEAAQRAGQLVEPVQVGCAGHRVDEAALVVAHLDETELRDVARDGRLHGVDAERAQRVRDLGLRRERLLLHEPQDRSLPFELRRHASTSVRSWMPSVASSWLSVSGGVSRSVRSPALPITSPCASAASTTGAAGRSSSTASSRPSPRTAPNGAKPVASCSERRADVGEQIVVDRVEHGARGGARDRVAAERRGVVARLEARRCVVRDEQRADRQPVREALGERDRVRPDAVGLPREERAAAADAGLHLVEDQQRAVRVGELACLRERLGRERMDAALALHRLEQDRRGVRADVLGERRRCREARAGDERLERSALRRLPGHRQRAERAPVERAFERHDLGAPGRLARPLERSLDRLGARVAEERLRAAEAIREPGGELAASARSSRGSRRARAGRAARVRRRAARGGGGRGRRRRCRRRDRGSASRPRRRATSRRRRRT